MPDFKYREYLFTSDDKWFDILYSARVPAPVTGVYPCDGCEAEVVATQGQSLPDRETHPHKPQQGAVSWRLVAKTRPPRIT